MNQVLQRVPLTKEWVGDLRNAWLCGQAPSIRGLDRVIRECLHQFPAFRSRRRSSVAAKVNEYCQDALWDVGLDWEKLPGRIDPDILMRAQRAGAETLQAMSPPGGAAVGETA